MGIAVGGTDDNGFELKKSGFAHDLWRKDTKWTVEKANGEIVLETKHEKKANRRFDAFESDNEFYVTSWDELPKTGYINWNGFRDSGKTANIWFVAEALHTKTNRPVTAVLPEKAIARSLFPSWVNIITDPDQIKSCTGHIVVGDEMALQANAREFRSDANKAWVRILAIIRQLDILMLSASQHSRQIDVQLIMDVDWMVFKKPSQMHVRMARGELQEDLANVWEYFKRVETRYPDVSYKEWAYVSDVHNGRVGGLRNGIPTFWTDKISKYFGAAYAKMTGDPTGIFTGDGR